MHTKGIGQKQEIDRCFGRTKLMLLSVCCRQKATKGNTHATTEDRYYIINSRMMQQPQASKPIGNLSYAHVLPLQTEQCVQSELCGI